MQIPFNKKYIFFLAIVVLGLFKIFLVSKEEIIAYYKPHDDLWHVLAASRGYWFDNSAYDYMKYIHLPMYPIYIALMFFTGIPLRICTELLFLSSSFIFIFSLYKLNINKILCVIGYAFIILHPFSFELFNHTLAETFYVSILLLSLSGIIYLMNNIENKRIRFYSILTGISLSILWYTRPENLLILGLLIFLIFISIIDFIANKDRKYLKKSLLNLVIIPFIIISIFSISIKTINYRTFGLFVNSEMDGEGYKAAYKALLKIKTDSTQRFIPISTETRNIAYSVSPSFAKLEPYLENKNSYGFIETKNNYNIEDIAAGWFYWVLRDSIYNAGFYDTAREGDEYFQQIADEINQAFKNKKIEERFVLVNFIDPHFSNYIPHLHSSFYNIWKLFISTAEMPRIKDNPSLHDSAVVNLFNHLTNRRAALIQNPVTIIGGWAFGENDELKQINLENKDRKILSSTEDFSARPDVNEGFAKQGLNNIPSNMSFILNLNEPEEELLSSNLIFKTTNNQFILAYKDIMQNHVYNLKATNSDDNLLYAVDTKVSTEKNKIILIPQYIQSFIWDIYGKIIEYGTYLSFICIAILIFIRKKLNFEEPIYKIILLLFFVIISRMLLFTFLDASSWNGQQPRYLFPIMPLYSILLLQIFYITISNLSVYIKKAIK